MSEADEHVPPATVRLAFRHWKTADLEPFHAICSNPLVMRYVADGSVWSRQRTAEFLQRAASAFHRSGFCQWALVDRVADRLIGFCGLADTSDVPAIGWRLAPEYWHRGLATEAARNVLFHAFGSLGIERVTATVQADNHASRRITEKLGMTLVQRDCAGPRELWVFAVDVGRFQPNQRP